MRRAPSTLPIVLGGALLAAAWVLWSPRSREPLPRPSALEAGQPLTEPDGLELSFPLVATTPAEVRQVVRSCRSAGPGDVPELRYAALRSPDPLVAGNAVRALGRLCALSGDPDLEALLADPRLRVRQETILALGQSADPAAAELLLPFLESPDPDLRPLAIRALGSLGADAGRAAVTALSGDPTLTEAERVLIRDVNSGRLDAPPRQVAEAIRPGAESREARSDD